VDDCGQRSMSQCGGTIRIYCRDVAAEFGFRMSREEERRPKNFPGSQKSAPTHSPSNSQQEISLEAWRVAPPAEQAGATVRGRGHITSNEVGDANGKPLLTGRSVALLAGASGAVAIAAGGVASAAGLPLDGAFMIGMLSVSVFSTVTAVYKDLRNRH
jgi:hypothetical protein